MISRAELQSRCRGYAITPAWQAEVWAQAFRSLSVGSSALTELSRLESQVSTSAGKGSSSDGHLISASSSSSCCPPSKSASPVEVDHQLALALSEDYPQVDKELARRIHDLDSIPVSILFPRIANPNVEILGFPFCL
jgi:hypothetical protein